MITSTNVEFCIIIVLLILILEGIKKMSTSFPAIIQQAISDLGTAVATETATLTEVLEALQAAGTGGLTPAQATALAAQIETSVTNLNSANSTAQAILNPPAPAAPAAPSSDVEKK
jgi:hypothetical protein